MTDSRPRRQRRPVLTDKMVRELRVKPRAYFTPDPLLPAHGIRVQPSGAKSYYCVRRDVHGKLRWIRLGSTAELEIEQARAKARGVLERLAQGLAPFEPPAPKRDSVGDLVATFLKRHVEARGLRSGGEIRRILDRHVLPVWRDQPFAEIRRSDIAGLLDAVEDAHGPWVADTVLTTLRTVAAWYAGRHDTYVPPFVRNMRRVPAQQRKRSRVLDDDELRRVWAAAEADSGSFGALVRLLLLTAQRREKVATMRWDDVAPDGTWTIPTAEREKGNPGTLRLPPLAMDIINGQPRLASNPFVLTGSRPGAPISGFATRAAAFRIRCAVPDWSLHDLRRCSRSLMSRSGVSSEHAERVLGHVLPGVRGVYDRHAYAEEKADALRRLAALIDQIVHGEPGANVVPMRPAVVP